MRGNALLLIILLLLSIAIGLQSNGHAQGNLVNLFNWTFQTNLAPGVLVSQPSYETIVSAEAVLLYIGQSEDTNPRMAIFGPLNPNLVCDINTIPGATYELFCTLQNLDAMYQANPTITFGNFSTNFVVLPSAPDAGTTSTIDFTVTATSATTMMSFNPGSNDDTGGSTFSISNFSLVETPEVSASTLFGVGGTALLLAHGWRRYFQNDRCSTTSRNASRRLRPPGAVRHTERT